MAKQFKAQLNYGVRETLAPGETKPTQVPVIIDRVSSTELSTVIEKCIDRGLIAGIKSTAAEGIAEGIAEQIAKEFQDGHGVAFGQYFYGRLYLNGTVGSNGTLTAENKLNVRLYKGELFKLSRNDFTLKFEGDADKPKVTNIVNTSTNTRGEVVPGVKATVNGRNLNAAGDTNRVEFYEAGVEGAAGIAVDSFTAAGPDILSFICPSLTNGKQYEVVVYRTDTNGVTRSATGGKVSVVGGETPPVPEPEPTLEAVWSEGQQSPVIQWDDDIKMSGANLALGAGGKVDAQLADTEETETWYDLTDYVDGEASGADEIVLKGARGSEEDEGVWNVLGPDVEIDREHSQVRFRVTTAGGSATIVADTLLS